MSARFIRRGVSKFLWSPTIADKNAVTRAELESAEDITKQVAEVAGWMLENTSVPTPDAGSTFDSSIPGTDTVNDSTVTLYEDMDEEELEALFPKLAEGYFLILRKGDKPGSNSLDCFPSRVASKGSEIDLGNTPSRFVVKMNITEEPGLDGPVPPAPPVVTAIAPTAGVAAGGTALTITGVGLTGATGGTLGGAALTSFVVVNPTTITAVAPAHAAGLVSLVINHPSGNKTKANAYTYV